VYFFWKKGPTGFKAPRSVLYIEGWNDNKLKIQLSLLRVDRSPADAEVKSTSRYPINEFGFRKATQRVLDHWLPAQRAGKLHVEYLGLDTRGELGNRACHVFRRTKFAHPEDTNVEASIFYFDKVTWLQVGSVLIDGDGEVVGEYFFRDIQLNPKFAPNQFEPSALRTK
jgi:hypothetical protein